MGAALGELLVYPTYALSTKPVDPEVIVWHSFPSGTPGGGERRPFIWLPAEEEEDRRGNGALIYFHANAETLADVATDMRCLRDGLRMSVLAVEYPGYGLRGRESRPGAAAATTTEGIDGTAIHALRYLVEVQRVLPTQVILHGRSLGSGPALRLALYAREELLWTVGAVVLQAAYTSLSQVGLDYAGAAGLLLTPNFYDNLATLRLMCSSRSTSIAREHWVPLLLLHGEFDEMVPNYHSMALHDEAVKRGHPAVRVHFMPGGTHNCYKMHEDVVVPIMAFKAQLVRKPKKGASLARYPMPKIVLEGADEGVWAGRSSTVMRCCAQTRACEQQCATPQSAVMQQCAAPH